MNDAGRMSPAHGGLTSNHSLEQTAHIVCFLAIPGILAVGRQLSSALAGEKGSVDPNPCYISRIFETGPFG